MVAASVVVEGDVGAMVVGGTVVVVDGGKVNRMRAQVSQQFSRA